MWLEITAGHSSLLALIQSLEGALVGPDPYVRGRGVWSLLIDRLGVLRISMPSIAVDSVADVLTRISSAEVSEIAGEIKRVLGDQDKKRL